MSRLSQRELIFALAKSIRRQTDCNEPIRNLEDAVSIILEHLPDAIGADDELAGS